MAEDRSNDPKRKPNLGLPNFVEEKAKSLPSETTPKKVIYLPPVLPEDTKKQEIIYHSQRGKRNRSQD
jgi:hypothetical protein